MDNPKVTRFTSSFVRILKGCPSLFDSTGDNRIVDEYTFGQYQSKAVATAALQVSRSLILSCPSSSLR